MTIAPDLSSSKPTFSIAVRSLVEFVLRSGDLRYEFMRSASAVEGIRAHQQIQRRRPPEYQAEVPVTQRVEHEDFELCITGRIDGVMVEDSRVVVEEIKATRRPLEDLAENFHPLHWGQAKCYAYLWALQHRQRQMVVRLTYMHMESGHVREIERFFDFDGLETFFKDLVSRYVSWVSAMAEWGATRDKSIAELDFPFKDYRQGQREMAVAVYRTIRSHGRLLLQAATGIGKTMGALYPAIKALGEHRIDKIVFLTARTTGRLAAQSALETLARKGLQMKSISITAKEKICFYPAAACVPEECACAKGHFDRVDDALADSLQTKALTRKAIEKIAANHQVCPFELTLELVNWCDCVICDYNYAFAPGVMLQRLFGEEGGGQVVLIDEAHNLVDRSRQMFSASLNKSPVLRLRRQVKEELPGIYRSLGQINGWMAGERRRCRDNGGRIVARNLPAALIERLKDFLQRSEKWFARNRPAEFREQLLEVFFGILHFIRIAEGFDDSYALIEEASGDELMLKLFCIDPANQLQAAWTRCRAAVLFSATLSPAGYFQAVLGCGDGAKALNLPSPFPLDNLAVFVADRISTLYRERRESCAAVVRAIIDLVEQRQGHYLVFFPSHEYMRMVHERFLLECPSMQVVMQSIEMPDDQRDAFLERFHQEARDTLVGFAVLGGIFGEGIDLKGERLTGAVIVGVGLPGICIERDLIRDHYEGKNRFGFEFAYQYPGINRVLQAAGRVIRSETDRGVILLIDRRYNEKRYKYMLPDAWNLQPINHKTKFEGEIRRFWERSI
ncbi:MAG: helicase C-terminal domain-containing protein [Desulfobacteraceae bacterium]